MKQLSSLICLGVILLAGCSAEFMKQREQNALESGLVSDQPSITWVGVTTFLVDDGRSQVLFDGFFSRPDKISAGIAPDLERIQGSLEQLEVRSSGCTQTIQKCPTEDHTGLELIIPFHGHFDHALDSPAISSITGATLVSDNSVESINFATRQFLGDRFPPTKVVPVEAVPQIFKSEGLKVGGISVRLFETPHVHSIASKFASGVTEKELSFPARVTSLKEGKSFSALVTHKDAEILIVPSAGSITDEFTSQKVSASTVILGIGLAGWKSKDELEFLWLNAVKRVGACKVTLVHWDNASGSISKEGPALRPLWFFQLDRTWRILSRLAERDGVQIVNLPVSEPVSLTALGPASCQSASN